MRIVGLLQSINIPRNTLESNLERQIYDGLVSLLGEASFVVSVFTLFGRILRGAEKKKNFALRVVCVSSSAMGKIIRC